jgi:hypothetical protein
LNKLAPDWNELCVAKAVRDGQLTSPQTFETITFFDVRVTGTGEAFRSAKRDEKGDIVYDEERVWREPSIYLNPEFLERVNAVPVILEHPDTSTLTTEEYRKRTIGALTLPYIKGEEVWAIARIQDQAAAKIMTEEQLSTSPAVSWNDPTVNVAGKLRDGSNFMLEGKPTLLDHLAVCWQGVWDKDGAPQGINISRGDSMDNKELQTLIDQNNLITKALGNITGSIETFNSRLDSVEKRHSETLKKEAQRRLDSFKFSKRVAGETNRSYQERHDSEEKIYRSDLMHVATGAMDEEIITDKARKDRRDAEEAEEKETKADAFPDKKADEFPDKKADAEEDKDKKADAKEEKADADDKDKKADAEEDKDKKADAFPEKKADADDKDKKADAGEGIIMDRKDSADLRKEVLRLQGMLKPVSDADLVKIGQLSKRCDSIYVALGESMPRLMPGEGLLEFHRKLAADLKKHTKYKDSELSVVAADSTTFDLVTEEIFRQAEEYAKSPARIEPGALVMRTQRLDSGHRINTFEGSSKAWMSRFAGPVQNHAKKFMVPGSQS